LQSEAEKLGAYIGQAGHTLVYGGSHNGLMGVLARSAKNNGARVIGVEPQFFIDAGFVNDDVDELYVTETMSERKNKMIELGDAFMPFPAVRGPWRRSVRSWPNVPCAIFRRPASSLI
ncbi:MAG: LOG family protein, partial [Erysipelotrichaceae bacterium]|nr:LOG family protein [Erysipelotrichaceae bacterium]